MKYLTLPFIAVALFSCTEESPENPNPAVEEQLNVTDTIVQVDTMQTETVTSPIVNNGLSEEDKTALKSHLKNNEIEMLTNAVATFNTTNNDLEVVQSFLTILAVTDTLKNEIIRNADYEMIDENDDYYPFTLQTELASLEQSIPGFLNSCVAECTEYDCRFELAELITKSKATSGTADDDFFEALSIANGENMTTAHQFRAWFAQFWDYGGATFVGSDIHLNFLNKAKNYKSKYELGNEILNNLVQDCYGDLSHGIYMNSPEMVAAELNKIIALNIFTAEENNELQSLASQIENNNFDYAHCVGGKLQFNCETGDCDFGG